MDNECKACDYVAEDGTCGAFECNGFECPVLPCEEYWIFTFGNNHAHPGKYVKIRGTFNAARQKMFNRFGDKWAFQYSQREWEEWLEKKPAYLPEEKLLEVID